MPDPKRGEVWLPRFDVSVDAETLKIRPADSHDPLPDRVVRLLQARAWATHYLPRRRSRCWRWRNQHSEGLPLAGDTTTPSLIARPPRLVGVGMFHGAGHGEKLSAFTAKTIGRSVFREPQRKSLVV